MKAIVTCLGLLEWLTPCNDPKLNMQKEKVRKAVGIDIVRKEVGTRYCRQTWESTMSVLAFLELILKHFSATKI